jgi:hypothetical protein
MNSKTGRLQSARRLALALAIGFTALLSMGAEGGCGEAIQAAAENVPDFRGAYEISHADSVKVYLTLGAAEYIEEGIQGQIIDVGGVEVDMGQVCELDGVHCPSEIYWSEVGFDQPYFDHASGKNPWLVKVINLSTYAYQLEVGGLVNSQGDMTLLLGLVASGVPPCGLLGASISTADFVLDVDGVPTGELVNGRIKTTYAGGCLFPNDDAMVGATVTFETLFTGQRTGPLTVPDSLHDLPTFDENGEPI